MARRFIDLSTGFGANTGRTPGGIVQPTVTTPPPPPQPEYTATVQLTYPNAVLAEQWGSHTVKFIANQGYSADNVLYALGICSDDADAFTVDGNLGQYPTSMNSFLGPFMAGGLAGYPFVGSVGFGAFASHITDTGALFISCTPHIGITVDGEVGYQNRKGQASTSTNCGAVHGAVGLVRTDPNPPDITQAPYNNENYELWRLADIIYPYSASFNGTTSQNVAAATSIIRNAGFDYIKNNSGSFAGALQSRPLFAIGGTFINTDYGYQAYVEVNQFWKYTVAGGWNNQTSAYLAGLLA